MISKATILRQGLESLSKMGYTFAVGDSEGNIQKRTGKANLAFDAIDSVEESYLRVWEGTIKGEGHLGYLYFSGCECFDHTDNERINNLVNVLQPTSQCV